MTDPRQPIPGTPEADMRAWLAEQEAAGAMERPKPVPRGRLASLTLLSFGWAPVLAIGYGVGRWAGWW